MDCDKELVRNILNRDFNPSSIVSTNTSLTELPTVEERIEEIKTASFDNGRPTSTSFIPILSSIGCPYTCNFCIDWDSKYYTFSTERLKTDLHYISKNFPKVSIGYHDPNFAVKFDQIMDIIETLPPGQRNGYVMESSLSIIKESRLHRLKETNCIYVLPGIESWNDYSNKAGSGNKSGQEKFDSVVRHLDKLSSHVEGIQANLIFGTDADSGPEPVQLTKQFIKALPAVWPALNIPIPYGGTPLTNDFLKQDRIIRTIPFMFYRNPYLTFSLAHYDIVEYYSHWCDIRKLLMSKQMLLSRVMSKTSVKVKFMNSLRTLSMKSGYIEAKTHFDLLKSDKNFRSFHEQSNAVLPDYYHQKFENTLGPYSRLISRKERIPVLDQPGTTSEVEFRV
jgi:radical SAM superfamily enzyme YgiQ (UPF0313 family)